MFKALLAPKLLKENSKKENPEVKQIKKDSKSTLKKIQKKRSIGKWRKYENFK